MAKFTVTRLFGAGRSSPKQENWKYVDTPETCRIYFVHAGHATFIQGETTIPLTAGKLYFIPPRLPFQAMQSADDPMDHTYFDFFLHPQVVSQEIVVLDSAAYPELLSLIMATDSMMHGECRQFTVQKQEELVALRGCLETILNRIAELHALKTVDDPVILAALDLIEKQYTTSLRVREIAEQVGYCTDHFIRRFQKAMGITPYQYIKALRLHDARILRQEGMTLQDAAMKTGYSCGFSLSRVLQAQEEHVQTEKVDFGG